MVQTRSAAARSSSTPARHSTAATNTGAASSHLPAFDDVHNLRDLAEVDPAIYPGRVYRAAAPVSATDADVKRLYNDLAIRELIDLRSTDELKMLPSEVCVCVCGCVGGRGGVAAHVCMS